MTHRGPDGGGVWSDPTAGIWLSHRRLAIRDLSAAGAQPMATPDGTGQISYNGEVYNVAELRPELEAAGYRFRGHSDTEVILYACHRWGVKEACRRLIGMFAFAYWDSRQRTLSLVRDRLGKKPLYWLQQGRGIAFASELRPLMAHPECPREIDRQSVAEFLRVLYVPDPNSILQGVGKLPAGCLLRYDWTSGRTELDRYWDLGEAALAANADPFRGSVDEALDQVDRLLGESVRTRTVSDVPLGAFLSGGIDSSLIVALLQRTGSGRTRTFTIGFAEGDYDESEQAEQVARHLGTDHTRFTLTPRDCLDTIPHLPEIFDEPFADPSQVPTYLVSRLARDHVTVAMTGDGGDEVFGGYNRHVAAAGLLARMDRLPGLARRAVARTIQAVPPDGWQKLLQPLPERMRPRLLGEKLHKFAPLLELTEEEQYRHLISQWQQPDSVTIGGSERHSPIADRLGVGRLPDRVSRMRLLDLATYLPGDILTKVDRASMAVSLETRTPFLDHRLVEFSFRLPTSFHVGGGKGKLLLRRLLERHVPSSLFDRPKMGFGLPIGDWLRRPLRDWAEGLLAKERLEAMDLVRAEPVRQLWHEHLRGTVNAQYRIWPVLMLAAWWECYRSRLGGSALQPTLSRPDAA